MAKLDEIFGKRTLKEMLDEPVKENVLDVVIPDVKEEKGLEKVVGYPKQKSLSRKIFNEIGRSIVFTAMLGITFSPLVLGIYVNRYIDDNKKILVNQIIKNTSSIGVVIEETEDNKIEGYSLKIQTYEGIYTLRVMESDGKSLSDLAFELEKGTKVRFAKERHTSKGYENIFNTNKIGKIYTSEIFIEDNTKDGK